VVICCADLEGAVGFGERPSIAVILAPVFATVPRANQPILTALAERIAARRYRSWADEVGDPEARRQLFACAEREEEIAKRVEALYHGASALQREFEAAHPDLEATYASLFTGASLVEQFALQAEAERIGAATWRSFAAEQGDPSTVDVFRRCAQLEEESAAVLEKIVASGNTDC
jgi:hypothetical protein